MTPDPSAVSVLHVRALRSVVENGSFSQAARELGYTTSAVSQQISVLEKTLGVVLFERGPRSVKVTVAGEKMYELSANLLSSLAGIADGMRRFSEGSSGRLLITAVGSAAAQLMPRAVAHIVNVSPAADVSVVSSTGAQDDVSQAVRTGAADIGVVYEYSDMPASSHNGLVRTALLKEELVVLGRDQGASGLRESVKDFRDESWICGRRGSVQDTVLQRVGQTAGFTPRILHRSDDLDVTRGFVSQGLGIALVPILALGIDRKIRLYRPRQVAAYRRVHLVHRATDNNPLLEIAVKAFRDAANDFLAWSMTAFGVTFENPMLTVVPELKKS